MTEIQPLEIPESHITFANQVAEIAEKNGMKSFTLEYEPDWLGYQNTGVGWDRRVQGKAQIIYRSKDGRGRPCRNLSIKFDASINHVIEQNQESSN